MLLMAIYKGSHVNLIFYETYSWECKLTYETITISVCGGALYLFDVRTCMGEYRVNAINTGNKL